jgi:tight adherence protein C
VTLVIAICAGISVFFIMQFFLLELGIDGIRIEKRLESLEKNYGSNNDKNELDIPFRMRVINPIIGKLSHLIENVTPKRMVRAIGIDIARAGTPWAMTQSRWIFIRLSTGLVLPFLLGIYLAMVLENPRDAFVMALVVMCFANVLPRTMLSRIAKERKLRIEHEMPDALDLITVCVEAGIPFDGALGTIVEKMEGPLSEEFKKTIGEMKLGVNRKQALSSMGERCDVPELTSFLAAVIQADELGVSIANVLRVQSIQLREKRKQKAQEKAMKAPIKILFPLIFFIFPAIFVVILGPSVIRMIDIFGR